VLRLSEGTLLESVADLAFVDEGKWTVVDFKTDVELTSRAEDYRKQVALYVRGLSEATAAPARGVILRV
jgi:ATP-dependent exoDNAse (exonuclease V) beta subunit